MVVRASPWSQFSTVIHSEDVRGTRGVSTGLAVNLAVTVQRLNSAVPIRPPGAFNGAPSQSKFSRTAAQRYINPLCNCTVG